MPAIGGVPRSEVERTQGGAPGKLRPAVFAFSLSENRCSETSPKQVRLKNQNPRNGLLSCHGPVDRGFGAVCFGASPVAAVFGSSPGTRLPRESISLYAKEKNAGAFGHILTWLNNPRFGHVDKWLDRPSALRGAIRVSSLCRATWELRRFMVQTDGAGGFVQSFNYNEDNTAAVRTPTAAP